MPIYPSGRDQLPVANEHALPNNGSRQNAQRLAAVVENYWRERGFHNIRCWASPDKALLYAKRRQQYVRAAQEEPIAADIWTIRSNMINGLPPANSVGLGRAA